MTNPLEDYMSNRRRDQEEAWFAGAEAMLDTILKVAQGTIDKPDIPVASKIAFELATKQYRRGLKTLEGNPFTIARASKVKAPALEAKDIRPPTTDREPGTAERE